MTLYDALKASKGLPVSDMYAALWGKSAAESGIKTLTGKLPLFFSTSENKLRDWTIYGNNLPGKNLFENTAESQTINGVTFTVDKQAGTITANGMSSSEALLKQMFIVTSELAGEFYFSGSFNQAGSLSTFDAYMYDLTAHRFITEWDGTTRSPYIKGTESQEALLIEGHNIELTLRIFRGATVDELIFKPMIREADTSADFEPYQVGVGEKTKNLLKITGEDELVTRGITFTHDKNNHTIRVNGQATGNAFYACGDVTLKAGTQYILNGCPAGGSTSGKYTYQLYIAGHSDWGSDTGSGLTLPIMTEDTVVTPRIGIYTGAGELTGLVFKPMLRPANTTSEFIPYGYQIPIDVRDDMTGEYIYAYDIFIGESPLTEGESISKSSTGIDIRTIADEESYPNILTTALTNKPEMEIKYKE